MKALIGCKDFIIRETKLIFGCQGVVQLGGPAAGFARGGPAKVGACKSNLFTLFKANMDDNP